MKSCSWWKRWVPYIQNNLIGLLWLKLALLRLQFSSKFFILHTLPRTWQKITGHRCSSWSSRRNATWDVTAMSLSKWQGGTTLPGWVLCTVQMILFTRIIFLRTRNVAMILTHDLELLIDSPNQIYLFRKLLIYFFPTLYMTKRKLYS